MYRFRIFARYFHIPFWIHDIYRHNKYYIYCYVIYNNNICFTLFYLHMYLISHVIHYTPIIKHGICVKQFNIYIASLPSNETMCIVSYII